MGDAAYIILILSSEHLLLKLLVNSENNKEFKKYIYQSHCNKYGDFQSNADVTDAELCYHINMQVGDGSGV